MSLVPEYDSESEENADDGDEDAKSIDNGKKKMLKMLETSINSSTSATTNIVMSKIPLKGNGNSVKIALLPSAIQLLNGNGISNNNNNHNNNNNNNNNVFSNPYKDAENAKIANLEMHVKMVDTEEHTNIKNGKKVCLNYRKGRCRYGNKCMYAHDSDLHDTTVNDSINIDYGIMGNNRNNVTSTLTNKMYNKKYVDNGTNNTGNNKIQIDGYHSIDKDNKIINDTEKKNTNIKRKYRPGLGNSVIPSKKVIKHYNDLTTITKTIP